MTMTAPPPAPETLGGPMTVARLREWVRAAQPGARLTYARGAAAALDCGPAVVREVQRIGVGIVDDAHNGKGGGVRPGLGLIRAHFMRGADREGLYVVVRNPRPVRAGELP